MAGNRGDGNLSQGKDGAMKEDADEAVLSTINVYNYYVCNNVCGICLFRVWERYLSIFTLLYVLCMTFV